MIALSNLTIENVNETLFEHDKIIGRNIGAMYTCKMHCNKQNRSEMNCSIFSHSLVQRNGSCSLELTTLVSFRRSDSGAASLPFFRALYFAPFPYSASLSPSPERLGTAWSKIHIALSKDLRGDGSAKRETVSKFIFEIAPTIVVIVDGTLVAVPPPNVDNNDCQQQDLFHLFVGELWS